MINYFFKQQANNLYEETRMIGQIENTPVKSTTNGCVDNKKEKHRVLSLDGGGIRGIGTLVMLAELELKSGKSVQEMFDAFVGTSTGGIIATCFAKGFTATKLLNLYYAEGDQIFDISWYHSFRSFFGILGPRYEAKNVEALAKRFFNNMELTLSQHSDEKDALVGSVIKPFAVTTFNTTKGFKLLHSHSDANTLNPKLKDTPIFQVIRATTAAPTYFEGININDATFIDGGVAANDPSLHAYQYGQKLFGPDANIKVYSFGTGEQNAEVAKENAVQAYAGKLAIARIVPAFMRGETTAVQHLMKLYQKAGKYDRFQFYLAEDVDLADVTKKELLMFEAYKACQTSGFRNLIKSMKR